MSFGKSSSGLGSPSWNIGWQQQDNGNKKYQSQLNGYLNYDSQYADFRGSVYHAQNATNWNAGVRGGVVLMRGGVFASRSIHDSFAVVSTDGMADIPVKLFNNKVGKTNQKGLLLVPNLSAYQKNPIELDITDLPENVQAEQARVEVVPTERSGVAVDFKLDVLRAAAFSLKDTDGQFIREGAMIKRTDDTAVAVVGFDGRSFIEQLAEGHNRFYVSLPENGGSCYFDIDYQSAQYGDSLPDLGDMLCITQPLTQN